MPTQTLLDQLFSKTRSAMLLVDNERRYVNANPAACEMLGLDLEDLLQKRIEDLSAPELRGLVPEMFKAFLEEGSQSGPYTLIRADGTEVNCSYSASASVMPGIHLSVLIPVEFADTEFDTPPERVDLPDAYQLTERERQILTLLALGDNNTTIASKLHLSPETVRSHSRSARLRLGARSRSHAIVLGIQTGQLDLEESEVPSKA